MNAAKVWALRVIADGIEHGTPPPINITTFTKRPEVLVHTWAELSAWAKVFGLDLADVVHDTQYIPEGQTMMRLGNERVELCYIDKGQS